jgi:hypothetical protein
MLRLKHSGLAAPLLLKQNGFVPPSPSSVDSGEEEQAATDGVTVDIVLDETELGRGRIGRVFTGVMDDTHSVVVKLVFPVGRIHGKRLYPKEIRDQPQKILDEIHHEGEIYGRITSLHGIVVPKYYGCFSNEYAICLVMENAGRALPFPYKRLPLDDR